MKKIQNRSTRDTVTKHGIRVMETKNLAVGYGRKTVVSGINQEMLKGQFICLLGPNGSGKTTILRTLSRLLSPLKGAVYLNGRMLNDLNSVELAKTLAVVLTEKLSPGLITAFEFAAMGRYPHTGFLGKLSEEDIQKTREALLLVNAGDISDRYFNELSDGEKQKAILARALAQEPEVIILDEPTLHLDLKHRIELIAILRNFSREKGITVIVSLHDVDLASRISEIVILVKNGGIIACGAPEEILNEDTVAGLYDLDFARFDPHLGTVELINNGNAETAFVIAGAGAGTIVYRLLSRNGYDIVTGIIHENDIDHYIARAMGATVIGEGPFEDVRDNTYHEAIGFIAEIDFVIDTGFPVRSLNRRNIELLHHAVEQGKQVYTLRDRKAAMDLYGESGKNLIYCEGGQSMLAEIVKRDS